MSANGRCGFAGCIVLLNTLQLSTNYESVAHVEKSEVNIRSDFIMLDLWSWKSFFCSQNAKEHDAIATQNTLSKCFAVWFIL